MTINGKPAKRMRFILKSIQMGFIQESGYIDSDSIKNEIVFEFNDSREIDLLIDVLNRYKNEMKLFVPEFRRTL